MALHARIAKLIQEDGLNFQKYDGGFLLGMRTDYGDFPVLICPNEVTKRVRAVLHYPEKASSGYWRPTYEFMCRANFRMLIRGYEMNFKGELFFCYSTFAEPWMLTREFIHAFINRTAGQGAMNWSPLHMVIKGSSVEQAFDAFTSER
jgi:hypothetical protein